MAASSANILGVCADVLKRFRKSVSSVEVHTQACLASPDNATLSEEVREAVAEVVVGCVQFRRIGSVVVDGFYAQDGKTCLRADRQLYEVLCYWTCLRMDLLGFPEYEAAILASGQATKLARFLQFFLSEEALGGWVTEAWEGLYDAAFVAGTLTGPLQLHRQRILEFAAAQEARANRSMAAAEPTAAGARRGSGRRRRTTTVQEFALTAPRPRAIPVPAPVPKPAVHKPVPKSTYTTPLEEEALARKRRTNRDKALKARQRSTQTQFACAATAGRPSSRKLQTSERVRKTRAADHKYIPPKVKAVPRHVHQPRTSTVKLNAAAILREEQFYRKQLEAEAAQLAALEAGTVDPEAFLVFEREEYRRQEEERLAEIERRRIEGQLSREEAIIARFEAAQAKQETVRNIKSETEEMLARFKEQQAETEAANKLLIEEVAQSRANAIEARGRLAGENVLAAQQMKEDMAVRRSRALAEAEAERQRRDELIRQIRALESIKLPYQKAANASKPADSGVLGEMSFLELRQRLALLKEEAEEKEAAKREEIRRRRGEKDAQLRAKLDVISTGRTDLNSLRSAKRTHEREARQSAQQTAKGDAKLLALKQQLAAKRAQRMRVTQVSELGSVASTATKIRLKGK